MEFRNELLNYVAYPHKLNEANAEGNTDRSVVASFATTKKIGNMRDEVEKPKPSQGTIFKPSTRGPASCKHF